MWGFWESLVTLKIPTQIIKLKNKISQIENPTGGGKSRLNTAEEKKIVTGG